MHPSTNVREPIPQDATSRRCEDARKLLEQGAIDRAIEILEEIAAPERTGAVYALLGTARFRKEQYDQAEAQLRMAIERGMTGREVTELLAIATANVVTGVADRVPERYDFDRAKLLAGPEQGEPLASGTKLLRKHKRTILERGLGAAGTVTGVVLGRGLGVLARTVGRESRRELWTTWYRHGFARAMLMLARRRERLNRENLFGAYPPGKLVGFAEPGSPPARARTARTADGSWNDLDDPMAGAAGTRFGYNTDPHQTAPETEAGMLLTPNPRTVSRVLMTRPEGPDGFKGIPFLNLLAGAWIQFMNHDWVSYGDPSTTKLYKIPLEPDDPARKRLHQTHMFVGATQDDPTAHPDDPTAGSHINEVTSWWDGSQIYGSDEATVRSLRSHVDGKLRMDPTTGNLPVGKDGVEETGFRRNWWLGLSLYHTLFAKEHNAICDMLKVKYPAWGDQQLFDTARLINAAVMAKIHTVEWTPAILPNRILNTAMASNWFGALTKLFRSQDHRRAVATFDVDDPILGGIVGNHARNFGVPYSLTREFLSVYRLHSLLPDEIVLDSIEGKRAKQSVPLAKLRQRGSHEISDVTPMADLLYSFGIQHPGQLVLNNYPRTLQNLSIPGMGFYDLGAVDVLRDRERGTPRYNTFRRLIGLKPINRFEDLTDDPDQVRRLREVYNNDIEQIDLLVGNLAESTRPAFFGFGETLFEVFILNASRRLQADRFFTDDYRAEIYTPAGLAWVDQVTFKEVLLRHFPELAKTGLANVENAFEPWDVGALTADRHPLRQYERVLQEEGELDTVAAD